MAAPVAAAVKGVASAAKWISRARMAKEQSGQSWAIWIAVILFLPIMFVPMLIAMFMPGGGEQRLVWMLREDMIGAGIPDPHIQAVLDAGELCEEGDPRFVAAMIQAGFDNLPVAQEDNWPLRLWAQAIDDDPQGWGKWWEELAVDANKDGQIDKYDPFDFIDWMGRAQCHVFDLMKQTGINPSLVNLYYTFALGDYFINHHLDPETYPWEPTQFSEQAAARFSRTVYEFGWLGMIDQIDDDGFRLGPGAWGGHANGRIPREELCPLSFAPGHMLRCDAAAALERMNLTYKSEHGRNLSINSTYRTYDRQVELKKAKGKWAAKPGTSNHGWGTAVDFRRMGTFRTDDYRWLNDYYSKVVDDSFTQPPALREGGSLPEPWHWEFGRKAS